MSERTQQHNRYFGECKICDSTLKGPGFTLRGFLPVCGRCLRTDKNAEAPLSLEQLKEISLCGRVYAALASSNETTFFLKFMESFNNEDEPIKVEDWQYRIQPKLPNNII